MLCINPSNHPSGQILNVVVCEGRDFAIYNNPIPTSCNIPTNKEVAIQN